MNKKGLITKQWLYTFYVVLNVIVLVLFITYINQLAENQKINQDFLSRDLGLIVDTLHNSPNPVILSYVNPASYELKIDKEFVAVNKPGEIAIKKYLYTRDNNIDLNANLLPITNSTLIFDKNKNILVSLHG